MATQARPENAKASLLDQDLFVPLRLEGSPRERQLIEVNRWKRLKPCNLLVKPVIKGEEKSRQFSGESHDHTIQPAYVVVD